MMTPTLISLLLCAVVVVVVNGAVIAPCGKGWVTFNTSCYKFIKMKAKYKEAYKGCMEHLNATLAEINSKAEAKFLIKTFGKQAGMCGAHATADVAHVDPRLNKGRAVSHFISVRIMHVHGKDMGIMSGGTWKSRYFICEKDSARVKVKLCKKGWVKYRERCYKRFDVEQTFADAEKACKKIPGANLAEINYQCEMRFLMYTFGPKRRGFMGTPKKPWVRMAFHYNGKRTDTYPVKLSKCHKWSLAIIGINPTEKFPYVCEMSAA